MLSALPCGISIDTSFPASHSPFHSFTPHERISRKQVIKVSVHPSATDQTVTARTWQRIEYEMSRENTSCYRKTSYLTAEEEKKWLEEKLPSRRCPS